ncbi:hypothetical protein AGR4A_Lc40031 [Agrobacterium tumefaciens str. B6]|uniref:Uncharacterized protein n=1 Tax=Agrobacterium tumefaciens str. B6 TaxID=1183423 RepID=A0A822V1V7_AGRTU|nr:hypothetical protein AGR4A_Lc40031 [Agrobacterium tumefaciens str. B6]
MGGTHGPDLRRKRTVCEGRNVSASSFVSRCDNHGDQGKAEKRKGSAPRARQFRSYAGMTRIRFKGPAQRHLSTVRCSPRKSLFCKSSFINVNVPPPIRRQARSRVPVSICVLVIEEIRFIEN